VVAYFPACPAADPGTDRARAHRDPDSHPDDDANSYPDDDADA
jgi:hypothetical protein